MLKVKSFKISDDTGINEILSKYRIAESGILVSNGEVCIPYEDGQEPTLEQRIIDIKKEYNTEKRRYFMFKHGQVATKLKLDEVSRQINELDKDVVMPDSKEKYEKEREIKDKKKHLENVLAQFEDLYIKNQAEIDRLEVEFKVYDMRINELNNKN